MHSKQMASIALRTIGAIDYLDDGTILTLVMLHSMVDGNKK
jgi:hypothetical protein